MRLSVYAYRFLHSNRLGGTVPALRFPELRRITLSENALTGHVPWDRLITSKLKLVSFAKNGLIGSLPAFPRHVQRIILHDNKFTGSTTFKNNSNLIVLTLHNNDLTGSLELPLQPRGLKTVLVHNNRQVLKVDVEPRYPSASLIRMPCLLSASGESALFGCCDLRFVITY